MEDVLTIPMLCPPILNIIHAYCAYACECHHKDEKRVICKPILCKGCFASCCQHCITICHCGETRCAKCALQTYFKCETCNQRVCVDCRIKRCASCNNLTCAKQRCLFYCSISRVYCFECIKQCDNCRRFSCDDCVEAMGFIRDGKTNRTLCNTCVQTEKRHKLEP